jgi:protein-tyrosine phosphatase
MVCLGNICRSPLAHGIMAETLPNSFVDSAGTGSYHVGSPPDPRSIQVAQDNGIDISHQSARQFQSKAPR